MAHSLAGDTGLLVECRSDSDFAGRPLAIHWQGNRETVKTVLFSWRTPSGKKFRVECLSEKLFDCSYSEVDELWTVKEI